MKAREYKNLNKKKKKEYGYNARKRERNWRMEVVQVNEAFQVCNKCILWNYFLPIFADKDSLAWCKNKPCLASASYKSAS